MDNLYMVKVPVAFMVRSAEGHEVTNAYCVMDEMDAGSDEFIYFGKPEIEQVF